MGIATGVTLGPVVMLLLGLLMTTPSKPQAGPQAELDAWRVSQDAEMRAPESPLARHLPIALRPGANQLGSAPDDSLRFESPGVPAHALELMQEGNRVR